MSKQRHTHEDYVVKALAMNDEIIIYAASTTHLVKEITTLRNTYPASSAALGRTLSIGLLMGAMLKGDQKLTITVAGDGPIGKITADVNSNLEIRGMVTNPHAHAPSYYSGTEDTKGKLNVAGVVGRTGYIRVVKDIGLKDYFVGQTEIVSGEIAEDFAYYFATSEQIKSAIAAGVLVDTDNSVISSGAYMIQLLPNATEETILKLERALQHVRPVSHMIEAGASPEDIVQEIVGGSDFSIVDTRNAIFKCQCSKERFFEGIGTLPTDEIEDMIQSGETTETVCHFCNKVYTFEPSELEMILEGRHIRG